MGEHSYPGEDTQPLDIYDLPTMQWQAGIAWSNEEDPPTPSLPSLRPTIVHVRTPEPALIRGLLMAVGGLTLMAAFHDASPSMLEPYFRVYIGVGPLILSWWIRRNVSPSANLKESV